MKIAFTFLALLLTIIPLSAKAPKQAQETMYGSAQDVKRVVVTYLGQLGYTIENEAEFHMTFAQPLSGKAGFVTQLLFSPPGCSDFAPRDLVTVTLVEHSDGTTLISMIRELERAGPFCRPVRETMNSRKVVEDMQNFLQSVKFSPELRQIKAMQEQAAAKALAGREKKASQRPEL